MLNKPKNTILGDLRLDLTRAELQPLAPCVNYKEGAQLLYIRPASILVKLWD